MWDHFEELVERLYGKRNKGRKKYLYALAIHQLLSMGDDQIKAEVYRLEGAELGLIDLENESNPGSIEVSAEALGADLDAASKRVRQRPATKRRGRKSG